MEEMLIQPYNQHKLVSCLLPYQLQQEANNQKHLLHLKSNLFLPRWQNLDRCLQQPKYKDKFQAIHQKQNILL